MQQICCICIHSGSANVVLEIYDKAWSKTEFCELLPGRKGPTLVCLVAKPGFISVDSQNSQNNRQSMKLFYVTLKLGVSRLESLPTVIGTDTPSLLLRTTSLTSPVDALTRGELHQVQSNCTHIMNWGTTRKFVKTRV